MKTITIERAREVYNTPGFEDVALAFYSKEELFPKPFLKWEDVIKKAETRYFVNYWSETAINGNSIIDYIIRYKNLLPTQKSCKKVLALCQAMLIAHAANDGWEPDWNDSNDIKWAIFKTENTFIIDRHISHNKYLFYFKSEELTQQALNENREIFETLYSW